MVITFSHFRKRRNRGKSNQETVPCWELEISQVSMKAIDWPRVCLEVELVDPDAAAGQRNR